MNFATFKEMTRIEHSLFGLPFTLSGALLPFKDLTISDYLITPWMIIWILLAFFLARTSGMTFNQWLDYKFDAINPRTQKRVIPSGKVSPKQAGTIAWATLIFFLFVCFQINLLCFFLGLVTALLIATYSLFKRINVSCHFILGIIHFLGPVMAWVSVTGKVEIVPICLGAAALLLVTGNDILYSIQDQEFDKQNKLFSIPAKFSTHQSILIAQILHALCFTFLIFLGILTAFSNFFFITLLILGIGFVYYYFVVNKNISKKEFSKLNILFFWSNFSLGVGVLSLITLEVLCPVM